MSTLRVTSETENKQALGAAAEAHWQEDVARLSTRRLPHKGDQRQ